MNARQIAFSLVLMLLMSAVTAPTASQPNDHIIVDNADTIRTVNVTIDNDLVASTAGVGPRVVLQYANSLRHIELTGLPSLFQTLLEQVTNRIIVQYANTIRQDDLAAVPSTLQTLLEQVSDRIIFQYANTNRESQLVYPAALINDTTAPQISDITASLTGGDSAAITWTTDEFADSEVLYGTQPGVYPQTVSDPLYTKQHKIILTELASGATYYYKVRSADRSGNTTMSSEHSFSAQLYVYLPLVMRNSP